MAVVYWIRLPHQSDPATEGYIGVTVNLSKRLRDHFRSSTLVDNHFYRAVRKYGWERLIKELVLEGASGECYQCEAFLRPEPSTGWNSAIGGHTSPMQGRSPSEETRLKMRNAKLGTKFKPRTTAHKEALRVAALGRKHSAETKAKLSRIQQGKTIPSSTRLAMSKARKEYLCKRITTCST